MTLTITRDDKGRYVVSDDRRAYGKYKTEGAALQRAKVVYTSRRPPKEAKR